MAPYRLFDPKDKRYVMYKETRDKVEEAMAILVKARRYKSIKDALNRKYKVKNVVHTPRAPIADTFNFISMYKGLPYRFVTNPMNKFYPYFKVDYSIAKKRSYWEIAKIYNTHPNSVGTRVRKWKGLFDAFIKGSDGWKPVNYNRTGIWNAYKKVAPRYMKSIIDKAL